MSRCIVLVRTDPYGDGLWRQCASDARPCDYPGRCASLHVCCPEHEAALRRGELLSVLGALEASPLQVADGQPPQIH